MNNPLTISIPNNRHISILLITDSHLFSQQQQSLLGVNTWESFNAVVDTIKTQGKSIDLIVTTGDVAQEPSVESYTNFAKTIASFATPCAWLPGNHDVSVLMQHVFADHSSMINGKHILLGEAWQIILLNSQVVGKAYGALDQSQLAFLNNSLISQPTRHTLISCHHHLIPCHCAWIDQHCLQNTSQLDKIVQSHAQVKGIVFGHIHQEMDVMWQGKRLLATPSTCVQFKPNCDQFTVDHRTPGWRILELSPNGDITTQVYRLKEKHFSPNRDAKGY